MSLPITEISRPTKLPNYHDVVTSFSKYSHFRFYCQPTRSLSEFELQSWEDPSLKPFFNFFHFKSKFFRTAVQYSLMVNRWKIEILECNMEARSFFTTMPVEGTQWGEEWDCISRRADLLVRVYLSNQSRMRLKVFSFLLKYSAFTGSNFLNSNELHTISLQA